MTRRCFLSAASAATWTLAATATPDILDTHVHFYDPERPGGVPWPRPTEKTLYRRVLPEHYQALSQASVIVVEASPLLADNDWILDLAAKHSFIRGCVGNLDPASPNFAANLENYRANPNFLGIRLGVAKASGALQAIAQLESAGLTLDLIGDHAMFPLAANLAQRYPKLRIVLDHLPLAQQDPSIGELKRHRNVYAKVSWILRSPQDTLENHREHLSEVVKTFGEDRVLYGSNWPVSDLIVPYAKIQETAVAYFKDKALDKYLKVNSQAAYRWK